MDFIIHDEPEGWSFAIWAIERSPTGIRLRRPHSIDRGEIVWTDEAVIEGQSLPEPTFRFNVQFAVELAEAILKRKPKMIEEELLKCLETERKRVDNLLQVIGRLSLGMLDRSNENEEKYQQHLLWQLQEGASKKVKGPNKGVNLPQNLP